jgi:hypothetical protein
MSARTTRAISADELAAAKDNAVKLAMRWMHGSAVCVAEGRIGTRVKRPASGTVVRTPRGRAVLLTCAHCVEDEAVVYSVTQIGARCGINDVASGFLKHPDPTVDVALVMLKPDAEQLLLASAVEPATIALPDDGEVGAGQWTIAVGFPEEYMREQVLYDQRLIVQNMGALTFGCEVESRDDSGRLMIGWNRAVAHDPSALWREEMISKHDPIQDLPRAPGVSGGPLWRFGPMPQNEVWSAYRAGRVIGVLCSWLRHQRIQFAEPVSRWGAWFAIALQQADEFYAGQGYNVAERATPPQER